MDKRITRRRKSKTHNSENVISSANSTKMFESCLPVPVLGSDCQVSATHDCSAVEQRVLRKKGCLKTNLDGNDTTLKNSSNVQDICLSVRSSDNDSGTVGDKSEVNSRKNKFESTLDLNEMSTENVLKVSATCESVKSVEITTKLKHDNTENVASYAITQPTLSRNIKMEVRGNDCIAKHDQSLSTNDKYSMYRRKIRDRKCKTCLCLNDIGFKNLAKISVASQSVHSINSNSSKDINYNHTQDIDIDGIKQLFIPIKDIKLEMPEYNSIIEHYQSIKTNENSAVVKRPSRERKCKTNLYKNDIAAAKSACVPILFPNAQVSDCDSQIIVPTDNSENFRRKISERKVKSNFNQNDLSTESCSKMPNTSPLVQLYDSFGQNITTNDNSEMHRRKNRERRSKAKRKLHGIVPGSSTRTPDTCTNTQPPIFHHSNTQSIAKDSVKQLIIPVKCTKKGMLEYDSDVEHCQTIAKNNNSAMKKRKNRGRNCKTNYSSNDIHSENPLRKPDDCPTPRSFKRYSKRCFRYINMAPDIKKDLITPMKRSKMEMSECNSLSERCQSIATDDNYAMNRRKSKEKKCKTKLSTQERLSENTAKMLCSCPPLSSDNDCRINAATDDLKMDRRKSRERMFKAGQCVNNGNSAEPQDICPAAFDRDSRSRFLHSNTQNSALNATKQLIILVKDIKMEMPEDNCFTQHCQSLSTKGNLAVDKRKSAERDISSENAATMLEHSSSIQSLEMRCQNKVIKENNAEDICKSETEDECNPIQAKDFSSTVDINNPLNNDSSIVHVEEREFSSEHHKSFDPMTEQCIPINDNFIPSLKKTDCSEYIEAVEVSIANDRKKFSSINDVGNAFVDKTPFTNFIKREMSLENCRTSEYCKDASVPVIQGMANNDESKINTKDDTETQTLVTCNMTMKQNSEIEFKIKVTRKIKNNGDDCRNKYLNVGNEKYEEKNIESKKVFINEKPESVSSMRSFPNECIEYNYNVNTSSNDVASILSGNDACCVTMDETSILNNKKRGSSEIKKFSQSIMDKNLREITNNDEIKPIAVDNVLTCLKRGAEVEGKGEIGRKSIKIEKEITEINEKSDDILVNPKIDNFHLLHCYPIECTEKNRNISLSQIRNELSSSGTSDCHSIVDEASVFENINIESGRDKNNFENAMHENIHVKEEISNGDRATSIGTNDLPNTPPKGGVKSEISNNRKKAKSYIDNTNNLTVNEMHNRKVGSILILQNLSREFDSVASSSGTRSCSPIINDTSVLKNKKTGTLEIKNNSQSIMDKNLKEITNNDEIKPIAADNVLKMSLKRAAEVERNSEIARKSIKIENEITEVNEKSDDTLINPKFDYFHLLQDYPSECAEKNGNTEPSVIHNEPSSSGTSDCHFIVDEASVSDKVNTEIGRDKSNIPNYRDISIIPSKGGIKSEISNNRKKAKSCIDSTNKSTVNEIQNTKVGSIMLWQNLSSGFSSVASSSGIGSYILNRDETSVLNANSKSLENKGVCEILGLKNNEIKEKITNEDNTEPVQTDTIYNILQNRNLKVEENTEVNIKRKKTEHDCSNTHENILQELHLHLDRQKVIVDMLRNITRDINVRLLQKSFTEMCNNEDYNSRCYTGVFSHGNDANFADVNINSNEIILKNEQSKKHNILRNVVDKTVVIKKEIFNEKEDGN